MSDLRRVLIRNSEKVIEHQPAPSHLLDE